MLQKMLGRYLMRQPWAHQALAKAFTMWMDTCTVHWQGVDIDDALTAATPDHPVMLSCWHQHLAVGLYAFRDHQLTALASDNLDGRLLQEVGRFMGWKFVAGSSGETGREGYRACLEALNAPPHRLSITPDGPTGPAHVAKPGVVRLAKRTQAAVHPIAIHVSNPYEFPSWDRMVVPLKQSTITLHVGEALTWSQDVADETALADLQAAHEAAAAHLPTAEEKRVR